MLSSIVRSLPRQLNTFGQSMSRTYFAPAYFGIDGFKNVTSIVETKHGKNASNIKVNIEEALSKPDGKIFTEDLKNLMFLSKTDADIDLLLNAIRKYQKQDSSSIFNYNFEAPLMRLLYTTNKTDLAMSLFFADKDIFEKKSFKAGTLLLNKLVEEKRYDDAIKVFDNLINKIRENKKQNPENLFKGYETVSLVTEALLGQNKPESCEKAKQIVNDCEQIGYKLNSNSLLKLILLALNQNKIDMANELIGKIEKKSQHVINNLRIMTSLKSNRIDEAIELGENTNKMVLESGSRRLFFNETLAMYEELVGKLEGEKKNRVNDLIASIKQENKLINTSLNAYALRLFQRRDNLGRPNEQEGEDGQQRYQQRNRNQYDQERNQPRERNQNEQQQRGQPRERNQNEQRMQQRDRNQYGQQRRDQFRSNKNQAESTQRED